jgi:antitoxin ParD1/3/4
MPVTLTPNQEKLVNEGVASSQFSSPQEVLDEALRLFLAYHHADGLPLEELRREITVGLEQEARGEYGLLDIDAIIAEGKVCSATTNVGESPAFRYRGTGLRAFAGKRT